MITVEVPDAEMQLVALGDALSSVWSFAIALVITLAWVFAAGLSATRWAEARALLARARSAMAPRTALDVRAEMIGGVVVRGDGAREEGEAPDDAGSVVAVRLYETGSEHRPRGRLETRWREAARTVRVMPFVLRTAAGELVLVEPPRDVALRAPLVIASREAVDRRERLATLSIGMRVFVEAALRANERGQGPYREGAPGFTARPTRATPSMALHVDPPDARPRFWARFYGALTVGLLVGLGVMQVGFYVGLYDLAIHGRPALAQVLSYEPIAHARGRVTLRVDPDRRDVGGLVSTETLPASQGSARLVGTWTRCIAAPGGRVQLGSEVGIDGHGAPIFAAALLVTLLLLAGARSAHRMRRVWYEQPLVEETRPGPLRDTH